MRIAIYARAESKETKNIATQIKAIEDLAQKRGWTITMTAFETADDGAARPERDFILKACRLGKVQAVVIWKIDRWARNLSDLVVSLGELATLEIPLISVVENFDSAHADKDELLDLLNHFAKRDQKLAGEKIKAGIVASKNNHGRPQTSLKKSQRVIGLFQEGYTKSAISRILNISRATVIRVLRKAKLQYELDQP